MPRRTSLFFLAPAFIGLLAVIVALSPQVQAGPPPAVTVFDASSVRGSGREIALSTTPVGAAALLEGRRGPARSGVRLLAAAPDGQAVVVGPDLVGQPGPLTIATADGSQIEVALPGVAGAAFEPLGAWLAAVDLTGALWRVEAASGAATRLADGPFGPQPSVLVGDQILAIHVSSVEAPIWASAVLLAAAGGPEVPIATYAPSGELVYDAVPLADGAVAVVRHRIGGGVAVVRVEPGGSETLLLSLDAVSGIAIGPDGKRVAWSDNGRMWLTTTGADAAALSLGAGAGARFSPDGSLLLVYAADRAQVVDLAGKRVADAGPSACWVGDGRGCRP